MWDSCWVLGLVPIVNNKKKYIQGHRDKKTQLILVPGSWFPCNESVHLLDSKLRLCCDDIIFLFLPSKNSPLAVQHDLSLVWCNNYYHLNSVHRNCMTYLDPYHCGWSIGWWVWVRCWVGVLAVRHLTTLVIWIVHHCTVWWQLWHSVTSVIQKLYRWLILIVYFSPTVTHTYMKVEKVTHVK